MKQFLLIPFLLIATLFFSFAQPISTFAPVGAEWWYQASQYSTWGDFEGVKTHQYISKETTIYAEQECRRLEVFEHLVDTLGEAHVTRLNDEYVYNNDDTVFYYNKGLERFVPLYIFNVKLGDTLTFYCLPGWEEYFDDSFFRLIVDSVYSYEVNGTYLKRVNLKQVDTVYEPGELKWFYSIGMASSFPSAGGYVEKLGSLKGRFISHETISTASQIGFPIDPEILCYNDSSFSVVYNYKDTPVNEECLYLGKLSIDEFSELGKNIVVYPNPARDVIQLKLPDGVFVPDEISILDFTGKTVQTISSSGNNRFSVQNLPQGIYTVAISVEGGWYYVKMMKL